MASADRADALIAFVKWSGLRLIADQVTNHLNAGKPLRVITTTYTGVTERRALDWLVEQGAEVKVGRRLGSQSPGLGPPSLAHNIVTVIPCSVASTSSSHWAADSTPRPSS